MTPAVEVSRLSRGFLRSRGEEPVVAVRSVSFRIPSEARLIALIGPDGAGKSTLLKLLCGLAVPDEGDIRVLGYRPDPDNEAFLKAVAYMPQSLGLYCDLSVMENLRLFGSLKGADTERQGEALDAHYRHLLTLTGLAGFEDRLAGRLSGGMKQKLALCIALVRTPSLLLLDEPTVGVDPLSRRELWRVIREKTEAGMTCLFSTAYLEEAERADWVLCLDEGRLLASGTPAALMQPATGRTFRIDTAHLPEPERRRLTRRLMQSVADESETPLLDAVPRNGVLEVLSISPDRASLTASLATLWDEENLEPLKVIDRTPRLEDAYMLLTLTSRDEPEEHRSSAGRSPTATSDDAIIRASGISRTFGSFVAVAESTFNVRRGEIFGLLGPNGAGKTTTFRILCGLLAPSAGRVTIYGQDLQQALAAVRADLGYVAQKFSLYDKLTVEENLRFFARSYGFFGRELTDRVDGALNAYDLLNDRRRPAGTLSAGAKRDLAMASALLHEPRILFLDEATSGADPASRRRFWRAISRLAARGTTVVVTTHFMEEAEYCDRFLIQDSGRILAIGTPDEIRAKARGLAGGREIRSIEDAFVTVVDAFRRAPKELRP